MEYAISDIHGCKKTLERLLSILPNPTKLYFLGDYVDRGPDSRGVLDIVKNIPNAICLRGNHEDMMIKALRNPNNNELVQHWLGNGGGKCLSSFDGIITENYINFVERMPTVVETQKFWLSHAAIWNKDPLNTPDDYALWYRECEIDLRMTKGKRLICGHTPTPIGEIELLANKIVIDGGCVFRQYPKYGNLVALCLDTMQLHVHANIDAY